MSFKTARLEPFLVSIYRSYLLFSVLPEARTHLFTALLLATTIHCLPCYFAAKFFYHADCSTYSCYPFYGDMLLTTHFWGSMDPDTEKRLAAILMEEATRLRLQADKEGMHVYLRQPKLRGRPNSRFLSATVLGVQQANRTAEVNEMWRVRKKEIELDDRIKARSKDKNGCNGDKYHGDCSEGSSSRLGYHVKETVDTNAGGFCTSRQHRDEGHSSSEDGGLRDEEVDEFLRARVKRGRGAIGSRMDEPGPYLPSTSAERGKLLANSDTRVMEEWEQRVLGPEKPPSLKSRDHDGHKVEKVDKVSSKKRHRSKDNERKKRKERRSKHRH